MKRFIIFFAAAIAVVLSVVACNRVDENVTPPTVEIMQIDVTSTSITFLVIASDAEQCAYLVSENGSVDASVILSTGEPVESTGAVCKLENLEPSKTYCIVAAASNAGGKVMSNLLVITTKGVGEDNANGDDGNDDNQRPGGDNGNNDDGDDDNNGNNNDGSELPDIEGVETLTIVKTQDGRWYQPYNYYVTFVTDKGDKLIFDLYTLDETMSSYLPYGSYTLKDSENPFSLNKTSSMYVPNDVQDPLEGGYYFTDGRLTVDVKNGYYSIYFMLTYDANGAAKSVQGYYNGILSGASVPEGDNVGAKKLIEVLDTGTTSFKFRICAEEGQYWRCSVVDKRMYDQYQSNPGAWVVTYGFMLSGTLEFNWEDGKECEHVPGLTMSVTSATDYIILAALMDYSEGSENSLLGGVEVVQVRTKAESVGAGTVDVKIKEVGVNDVTFDCVLSDNVWCCYVALMKTADLDEVKAGKYLQAGYTSFEECMMSLIPGLSHDFMRQFLESQYDYEWENIMYDTSYTMCIKVVDMNNGVSYIELDPFVTKK